MNNVIIAGRLARDPEVRYTQDQKAVTRFTVACARMKRSDDDKQNADFIGCVAFGKAGELIEKYFKKGKPIMLAGHIQTGAYEKNGEKVYTFTVVADRIEFVASDKTGVRAEHEDGFEPLPEGSMPWD